MRAILVLITLILVSSLSVAAQPTKPDPDAIPSPDVTFGPGGRTIAGPGVFESSVGDDPYDFLPFPSGIVGFSNACLTVTSLAGNIKLSVYWTLGDPDEITIREGSTKALCYSLVPLATLQCLADSQTARLACKAIWRVDQFNQSA